MQRMALSLTSRLFSGRKCLASRQTLLSGRIIVLSETNLKNFGHINSKSWYTWPVN